MTKVFVKISLEEGLVDDVKVYQKEPNDLKDMDEGGDNGDLCYELEVKENNNENL